MAFTLVRVSGFEKPPARPFPFKGKVAPVFPGTAWSDPEFAASNPRPLGIPIQKLLSMIATTIVIAAVIAAVR